jgi:hypothetical protein
MTVSAAVKVMPNPPARVLSRNKIGASGASPPRWNWFICSRLSSGGVDPSMRQILQPLNSQAQSYAKVPMTQYEDLLEGVSTTNLNNIQHRRELAE